MGVLRWMAILSNLVRCLFEQLINIARYIERCVFVRMYVNAYMYVLFHFYLPKGTHSPDFYITINCEWNINY